MQELANILSKFIFKQLTDELIRQGHKLTGALIESFEDEITKQGDEISIEFLMLKYGLSLNDGIKPSKIPFSKPSGRGGTSKYIQGLMRFARLKFNADKKRAKQIAFAIATKQKKEGYPLTGKIGFIDNVLAADAEAIERLIADYFEATICLLIEEQITFKQAA